MRPGFAVLLWIGTTACGGASAAPASSPGAAQPITVPPSTAVIRQAEGCAQLDGFDATFALYVPGRNEWRVCNPVRASRRLLPVSTFKLANALIALETGVIRDPDAMVAWDGVERDVAAWNQDTSLRTGIRNSTVWFYQRVAQQVGVEAMRRWVNTLDYGNAEIGPDHAISHFWLDGALRISAYEQITFLDRLRRRALPMSERSQSIVIEILERERSLEHPWMNAGKLWVLRGKTGAQLPIEAGKESVGWFVGWTEQQQDGDAVFAFNMRLTSMEQLPMREALCKQLLIDNHVYFMTTEE